MSISYTSSIVSPKQLLIQSVIARHNIQWLCHFTHRQNLESIKQNGLLPRNLLPAEALITDQVRADQSNAICLSISKPNKWMFEMKQKQGADLCLILISPDVLYEKNCFFYPHNAATKSFRNLSISHFQGDNALEALFASEITYQKAQREPQSIYRNSSLVDCETTSDQAEVQCLDIIEPHYILHIFEENVPLDFEKIKICMEFKALDDISTLHSEFAESFLLQEQRDKQFIKDIEDQLSDDFGKVRDEKRVNIAQDQEKLTLKQLQGRIKGERKQTIAELFKSIDERLANEKQNQKKSDTLKQNREETQKTLEERLKKIEKIWGGSQGESSNQKINDRLQSSSKPISRHQRKIENNGRSEKRAYSSYGDPEGCLVLILLVLAWLFFL